jgi:hypothetical protein
MYGDRDILSRICKFAWHTKTLQPHNSSVGKITSSPRLPKKIFGCAQDLLGNDETRGWPTIGAGPGDETADACSSGSPWQGHTGRAQVAYPQLGPCHGGQATVAPSLAPAPPPRPSLQPRPPRRLRRLRRRGRPSESAVRVSRPSQPSESAVRVSRPSQPSESAVRVSRPSQPSESAVRVSRPSQPSEPAVRVSRPSQPSESAVRVSRPSQQSE